MKIRRITSLFLVAIAATMAAAASPSLVGAGFIVSPGFDLFETAPGTSVGALRPPRAQSLNQSFNAEGAEEAELKAILRDLRVEELFEGREPGLKTNRVIQKPGSHEVETSFVRPSAISRSQHCCGGDEPKRTLKFHPLVKTH